MESSRIFIKGLPPTFTEPEFRKHFSQKHAITDAKIFPNRRIGYVGYKTAEDAQKAVKYFNRTFIRMSRIGVELARSVQNAQSSLPSHVAPTALRENPHAVIDNGSNKRKRDAKVDEREQDPKMKEFLAVMKPKSQRKAWETDVMDVDLASSSAEKQEVIPEEGASDDEYELVPKKTRRVSPSRQIDAVQDSSEMPTAPDLSDKLNESNEESTGGVADRQNVSDADWARSRTSRLLGLLDEDEDENKRPSRDGSPDDNMESDKDVEVKGIPQKSSLSKGSVSEEATAVPQTADTEGLDETADPSPDLDTQSVRSTMRLFIRNLPFDVKDEELELEFTTFGNLEEVHVPRDLKTGTGKGFALLQFSDPDSAERALSERDGRTFQGRLLHILPAKARPSTKLDEFELSKLPLKKQQQIKKRREAGETTFNWNALYMNADAVVSTVAGRLGLSKSEVLDPTSSDAAVKQAYAETHIIQETKTYFKQHGVDLDAFKRSQRGDTAILVKNIPYDCSKDELRRLFEEHGDLKRFLLPPSGIIAIVEYANAAQCSAAFGTLAYRKIKSSVLFLEKAPKELFTAVGTAMASNDADVRAVSKTSASDLKDADLTVPDTAGISTLFVRNLNFTTTTEQLTDTFKPLDGFLSARVKTKTDPKKPGQVLSMGFGFLEFRSASQAQAALHTMDGHVLAGHKLQIRASHKGADAAEERRRTDAAKRTAGQRTKVVIKNLPFEATKKDIQALFGAYGQLRSVRVPKKMDRGARGFAFADFTTPKEAESAIDALRDTHLLGRRLVLDYAEADVVDAEAEIKKMQQKVGAQVNKMALQKLTSAGRQKFTTANDETDEA